MSVDKVFALSTFNFLTFVFLTLFNLSVDFLIHAMASHLISNTYTAKSLLVGRENLVFHDCKRLITLIPRPGYPPISGQDSPGQDSGEEDRSATGS